MNKTDDIYYIEAVRNGNVQAFSFLVDKYQKLVYTLALKLLKKPEEAEEMAKACNKKEVKKSEESPTETQAPVEVPVETPSENETPIPETPTETQTPVEQPAESPKDSAVIGENPEVPATDVTVTVPLEVAEETVTVPKVEYEKAMSELAEFKKALPVKETKEFRKSVITDKQQVPDNTPKENSRTPFLDYLKKK